MLDTPDALADLEDLVDQLPAAQQRARFGEELDRVGIWYQQKGENIAAFAAMIGACKDLRHLASDADMQSVRKHLKEVEEFADDTANADDASRLAGIREMSGEANLAMTQCQNALRRFAQTLVASEFLPLRATGELVGDLDPTSTLGRRLIDFAARVGTLHGAPARDFAGAVRSACAEAAGYRAEIDALAHQPERRTFLNALVAGTATLADVTPAILDWLRADGSLDRFAVKSHSQIR